MSGESYLTVQEVADLFNCTVQTIWRWAREKNGFPRPVKVAAGMTRWRGSEILAFEKKIWEAAK
ncbi:helix-turn-helix domain-containing protein [Breoghania sp.]|uniref:helix-turn-helix transcriptional regulator n=1 Tax=Breoghania sp. TaxID=2065378 RepID=UPI002AA7C7ED|nr:helix-turn-helix domain-containing protein [Breoghania sp.]